MAARTAYVPVAANTAHHFWLGTELQDQSARSHEPELMLLEASSFIHQWL
jgi:hypothetical protein